MHAGGGGERDALQRLLGEVRGLHLLAAARGNRVHPAELRVRGHGARERLAGVVGHPVERIRRVDELLEARLVFRGPLRPGHPVDARLGEQFGRVHEVDARLALGDHRGVRGEQRSRDHDAKAS